jgi:transposase InsO family protein
MAHANARLTPAGRLTLVGRIAAQPRRPIAHIAHEMGVSRTTAYRWWTRYQQLGEAGLVALASPCGVRGGPPPGWRSASLGCAGASGSARPVSPPGSVFGLHRPSGAGPPPAEPAGLAGPPDWPPDPPLRAPTARRPGPPGRQEAGPHPARRWAPSLWPGRRDGQPSRRPRRRWLGLPARRRRRPLPPGLCGGAGRRAGQTCARFWRRAHRWFALHGISVARVLSDNGVGYRSRLFGAALADTGVRHQRTRPYRPQTNGKVERCNRTLLEEWAYRRLDRSNAARDRALQPWVHRYNHHRAHTALGGRPPVSRINNLPGYYT